MRSLLPLDRSLPGFLLSLLLAALLVPGAAQAQLVVNTTVDETDGSCGDDCSLRDAVALTVSGGGIAVPAGTYVLTLGQITIDKDLSIEGAGARTTTLDGNHASRIFAITSGTEVFLVDLTLTRGNADGDGGAVHSSGTLNLVRCTVKDNTAFAAQGGGVAAANLSIDRSTFSGNSAKFGGGVYRITAAALTIVNSTFCGNVATAVGGAWSCGAGESGGTLDVLNSTFLDNQGADSGDALYHDCFEAATLTLVNTIIDSNDGDSVPDCDLAGGPTETSSHVLDADGSCTVGGPGDLPNSDPLLGPLADNGGPTDTHVPGAGSPALDAADAAVCAEFPVNGIDQRGVSRPQGAGCDIGAVEVESQNAPPDCTGAAASVARIWPPNHGMVPVSILGVTDPDGDSVTIEIDEIRQDEPTNSTGDGNTCPDAEGVGTATASVRAERRGSGDGRVYTLTFTATDEAGATCQGSVQVCVPKSSQGSCVDGGPQFSSTACGGPADATSGAHSHKSLRDLQPAGSGLSLLCGSHYPTLECDLWCDAGVLLCQ